MATRQQIAHVLRRATFGPRAEEVDAAQRAGLAATIGEMVSPPREDDHTAANPGPDLGPDPYAALVSALTKFPSCSGVTLR